jgi:hypothetical protein
MILPRPGRQAGFDGELAEEALRPPHTACEGHGRFVISRTVTTPQLNAMKSQINHASDILSVVDPFTPRLHPQLDATMSKVAGR